MQKPPATNPPMRYALSWKDATGRVAGQAVVFQRKIASSTIATISTKVVPRRRRIYSHSASIITTSKLTPAQCTSWILSPCHLLAFRRRYLGFRYRGGRPNRAGLQAVDANLWPEISKAPTECARKGA